MLLNKIVIASSFRVFVYVVDYLLFFWFFRWSSFTDAYFSALMIVKSLQFLSLIPNEMTMQYYNELKINKNISVQTFLFLVISFSFFFSLMLLGVFYVFADSLIPLIFHKYTDTVVAAMIENLKIMLFSIPAFSLINIHNNLLLAESKLVSYYLYLSIPPMLEIIFILIFKNIKIMPVAFCLGFWFSLLLRLSLNYNSEYYKNMLNFPKHKEILLLWNFLKVSFFFRTAHFIPLRDPITAYLFSFCPEGHLSMFNYAFQGVTVIYNAVALPYIQRNLSLMSRAVSKGNYLPIRHNINDTILSSVKSLIVFGIIVLTTSGALWLLSSKLDFLLFFKMKIFNSLYSISLFLFMFLFSLVYYIILSIEVPYTGLLYVCKKVKAYYLNNSIFSVGYFLLGSILVNLLKNSFAILCSLIIIQGLVSYLYVQEGRKLILLNFLKNENGKIWIISK